MAQYRERKKEDLFIKEKRRSKNFFVTSSAKMDNDKERTSTTISSSVFTKMKDDFESGDFLLDEHLISQNGSIIYMMQEMQQDLEDVYNEVSASSFQASYFPFARTDSGSFGIISSSLVPDKDSKYDLGSSGKEWNNLYVDGTAYIDSLDLNGTNINTILNAKALKTHISGAFTSLSASIATDINNAGGGTADFSSVGENIVPDGDNTRDLGSSIKEFRNLYIDGIAYLDTIANATINGATMDSNLIFKRAVIQPSAIQVTSIPQTGIIDMRQYSVVEIKQKTGNWSITTARPAAAFQEITIIGLTAGVIRHNNKGTAFTFSFANGSNLAVSAGQAYKFIVDGNNIWRQIH